MQVGQIIGPNRLFLLATVLLLPGFPLGGELATARQDQQNQRPQTYTDPAQADEDYAFQGEYLGKLKIKDVTENYGLQVIALGNGKFKAIRFSGGLPGAGYDKRERYEFQVEGKLDPNASVDLFKGEKGVVYFRGSKFGDAILSRDTFAQMSPSGQLLGSLKKVDRQSKSLGEQPPEGAVVLYSGASDAKNWKNGKAADDGHLMQGTTSLQNFGSHRLHIEFRLPYKPHARGQARGNSGIYVQGRWEVQMLDSFGLTGEQNERGGVYSVGKPDVNMCLPPLTWQTYDIEFSAAEFDADGKLTRNARMTVYHNGVKIHDDLELPNRKTTAAPNNVGDSPGPIYLQDHGNPVRYRNIWVLERGQ